MRKNIMKKNMMTLALLAGLLLSVPETVHADSLTSVRNVTFTGDSSLVTDYTDADVHNDVYSLQPGDDITITLNLKNDNAASANWYMTNKVLQSLEETKGTSASGGAYEYELVYTDPAGAREVLFTSDTVGGENNSSRVGLKAATNGLEDFFYLDTLGSGGRGVLTLRVALDGETQGNDYMNTLASLQLNFAVDTTPVNEETRTEYENGEDSRSNRLLVNENSGSNGTGTRIVKTGDENNLLPYIVAAGISGVLLLFLAIFGVKERKKEKSGVKALGLVLALCLAWGMSHSAEAAGTDGYTYTLRLYAGAQGTIDASVVQRLAVEGAQVSVEGGEVCVISGLHYGEQVVLDIQKGVGLAAESKYYLKGFRVSGEDTNASRMANPSVTMEGDVDYVVAYGIKGEMVAYTVNYEDASGNRLLPSETYYGNVGDRPVVAYQYIEGWQPQAYNLGKTLVADASQNVFTFIYRPVGTGNSVITNTVVVEGENVTGETVVTQQTTGGGTTAAAPGDEGAGIAELEDEATPLAEPEEYVSLDDEDTPLGGSGENGDKENGHSGILDPIIENMATLLMRLPPSARVGIFAMLAALLGAGIWLLIAAFIKRKKENEQ